ncbi:cation:proton antiporter [Streptomyces sp.]|uniref:cation:proton antiporter domain-containing protein n=1 Tax=Streptomyces sp. TaxID=1931 RepID=UPI002D6012E5|nr:cation:proton antiporter [Streptomyces sp.]HZF89580.1 cation:proton antiporter [Streptomyces sp.]
MLTNRNRARYPLGYLLLVVVPAAAAVALLVTLAEPGRSGDPADAVHPSRLLPALAVILVVVRLVGAALRRLGQPAVVGEIVAGLMLGPSVLGFFLPDLQRTLFPASILPSLDTLAQLGVVLFMFLVGLELPLDLLRRSGPAAAALAQASTAVPFLCGAVLAAALLDSYRPPGASRLAMVMFVGVAFAITAFPVLARILGEQRLTHTPLGTLGLATAGIGDVIAWCLLAAVTAVATSASAAPTVLSCALVTLYAAVMFLVVRPAFTRLAPRIGEAGQPLVAAAVLTTTLVSAWLTDTMGAHAIFGAFIAGVVMPRNSVAIQRIADRVEGLTGWVLLPVFFAVVGLKLDLPAVGGLRDWGVLALIVLVASAAKFCTVALFARLLGRHRRDAAALGLMMNCRGVTELIVLQLGLTLGVLSQQLFAMLTCMALVTTAATGPLLRRLRLDRGRSDPTRTTTEAPLLTSHEGTT